MNKYRGYVSLGIDNGKTTFFVTITAKSTQEARAKIQEVYPNGTVHYVVEHSLQAEIVAPSTELIVDGQTVGTIPEGSFQATGTATTFNAALENVKELTGQFENACHIMERLGGMVDVDHENDYFVQVNLHEQPDLLDKIKCMTRELVEFRETITTGQGKYSLQYFGMK